MEANVNANDPFRMAGDVLKLFESTPPDVRPVLIGMAQGFLNGVQMMQKKQNEEKEGETT